MRRPEIEILEEQLNDVPELTESELGFSLDLARDEPDDDEDDLGFRSLYEHPEDLLRKPRWADAA